MQQPYWRSYRLWQRMMQLPQRRISTRPIHPRPAPKAPLEPRTTLMPPATLLSQPCQQESGVQTLLQVRQAALLKIMWKCSRRRHENGPD